MLLSESYKNRLRQLAGLSSLEEAMDTTTKKAALDKSSNRVSFSIDMMKQAIEQGKEIGINFQSNNKKYKMPTTKSRIIWPVALGTDKNGDIVIRGYHIAGQSEKKAIETGFRTAEVSDEWRLFKAKNLKTMWFTDRNFNGNIPGYKPKDSAMISTIALYDPIKVKRFQDSLKNKPEDKSANQQNPPTT